jgi:hypothetical protein
MKMSMYFALIVGFCGFIVYPILYRIKRNYFNKHRKELTDLLYGYDPWGKTLSWSDHLLMSVAIGGTFLQLRITRKDIREKIASGKFEDVTAPNIFKNGNYLKLRSAHPLLEKLSMAELLMFVVILVCAGVGMLLEKFYGL